MSIELTENERIAIVRYAGVGAGMLLDTVQRILVSRLAAFDLRSQLDVYLTARGLRFEDLNSSLERVYEECQELIDTPDFKVQALQDEIADVVLALTAYCAMHGESIEDLIQAKTERDRGRGKP